MSKKENSENHPKIRQNVLETFGKLGKDNEKIVVRNGSKLLRYLAENRDEINGKSELNYALCRLIRGLGASSNETKRGFYTVLVGLLSCVDDVGVSEILEVGDRELRTSGGNSKGENADISAGQILLYGAIVRTGLFGKSDEDERKTIVEKLLTAGKKRDYLYLLAATFVDQICNNVDESYFKSRLFPIISPEVSKDWSEQNADSLYLLFVLRDRFPNVVNKKYLKSFLGAEEIVSTKNLAHLVDILINMPRLETANHPVYDLLSKSLASKKIAATFAMEADKLLLHYNHNRHTIFTLILTSIVANLESVSSLPDLITENYLRQTLQYFKTVRRSRKPEQLQQKIYDLLDAVVKAVGNEGVPSTVKIDLLKKLLFDPGTFVFEKITRTKMVQRVMATLDREGVESMTDVFKAVILAEEDGSKQKFSNNDKVYAAQLLVRLLGHDAVRDRLDWRIGQMKFIMEVGFVRSDGYSSIGNELAGHIRQSFYKTLTARQQSFDDVRTVLWELAQHLNPYVKKKSLRTTSDDDTATDCWKTAYATFEEIERSSQDRLSRVYQTLALHLAFHAFQDANLTKDSLVELQSCRERTNVANSREDALHFSEVMADLFLCLLSYSSSLLRNLVGMTFPHFTRHLTDAAFNQILYVLDPKNKDILEKKTDLDGNSETDDDGDSETSGDEDNLDEDSSSETEEDSDVKADDDDDTPIDGNLREAVHTALGQFGDEEIDLDDMSETEGQKLDEALATAFRKSIRKKPKKQSHKENLKMNFRLRVLDLIEVYLDNEPSMLNCVEALPVLLRLQEHTIRDPFQKQLLDRVVKTIKRLGNLKKFGSIQNLVTKTKLKEFLSFYLSLLERGEKNVFIIQAMRESISSACMFFIHCTQYLINSDQLGTENQTLLTESIKNITTIALDSYFLQRDPLLPFETFKYIVRTNYFGLYDLVDSVFSYVYLEDLKLFKKTQALDLAGDFFKNHRFHSTHPPTEQFRCSVKRFLATTRGVFEYSVGNGSTMHEKFVRSLFTLLLTIKRSPVKVSYSNLIGCIEKYKETAQFASVTKTVYNKLCRVWNVGDDEENISESDDLLTDIKAEKTLKKLNCRIEEVKRKLSSTKRKSEVLSGRDQEVNIKKLKKTGDVVNGDVAKLTNGIGENSGMNKRKSLGTERRNDEKMKRQSSVF